MVTVVVPCSLTVTVIPCSLMVTVVVPCFCVSAIATLLHVSSWDLLCLAFVFLPPLHCCMFPLSNCCTLLLCFRHSYTAVVVGMHSLYKQCKQTLCVCVCVCVCVCARLQALVYNILSPTTASCHNSLCHRSPKTVRSLTVFDWCSYGRKLDVTDNSNYIMFCFHNGPRYLCQHK